MDNKVNSANSNSIGILNERSLHRTLKEMYCENGGECEVKLMGFTADVFDGKTITEIQSSQFYKLRKKLSAFTEQYSVRIVYPIARTKYLSWIDKDTGEIISRRKSPKCGHIYDILPQIYELSEFIGHKNVVFEAVLSDVEEYRVRDGFGKDKKRRASHLDKVPNTCFESFILSSPSDYLDCIREYLPKQFTADKFAKALKRNMRFAYRSLKVLEAVGAVKKTGKDGRKNLYELS